MRAAKWLLWLVLSGCPEAEAPVDAGLPRLPTLQHAPLATESTWAPTHARTPQPDSSPSSPGKLQQLLSAGFGVVERTAGLEATSWTVDGVVAPQPGPTPRLLVRFVHLADTQLADDESPARFVSADSMGATSGAYRPQEAWGCRMLNAAVRTINAVHRETPVDFVVLGGDNADNAQQNEVDWFRDVLDGADSVDCDSGDDDDPTPGPGNDPKDAFFAEGLQMPWKWVTGNHDVLNQGNFPVTDALHDVAVGTDAKLGTRDWRRAGAPMTTGSVPADERRAPLPRDALLERVARGRDAHGLDAPGATTDGRAIYAIDAPNGPVRLVVFDSAAETGGAEGVVRRADLQNRIVPLLEEAEAQRRYVILVSHHAARSFSDGSDFGGTLQPDAITADEWRQTLGAYPHVVMHLAGHSHVFHTSLATPAGGHPFFETETASLADWPQQLRVFEVWDEGNGFVRIHAVPLDYAQDDDALAAEARTRAAADFTSGWAGVEPTETGAADFWFPSVD